MKINRLGRERLYFVLLFFAASGASFIGCSQPLRTLMGVGAEQKAQRSYVRRDESRFKLLLGEARQGRVKTGTTQDRIIARYGQPVVREGVTFLYRDPVAFFNSTKVYMDFDEKGLLKSLRIEEPDAR